MKTHPVTSNRKSDSIIYSTAQQNCKTYDNITDQQLISTITNRIKILHQEERQIQQKHQKMKSQIDYARPCDIKVNKNHEMLKKIVQSAISNQFNSDINYGSSRDISQFHKQNSQMEAEIQIKMKSIQQLDIDIRTLNNKEQIAFAQLQKSQQVLKNILKSKGSIEQAEKKERQKKAKINQIRYIRQNLISFKDQKITRIRQVIQCLKLLQHYRSDRIYKIEKMYQYNQNCNMQNTAQIINNFVHQLQNLKKQKLNMNNNILMTARQLQAFSTFGSRRSSQENVARQKSLNKKKNIRINSINSTPKANFMDLNKSFNSTSKKQTFKNQNHLDTKNIQNLYKSTLISTPQNYNSFQNIINQYEQIMKKFVVLREAELIYFQNKNDRINQQIRIKALQKAYLIGILGYDPNDNQDDFERYQNIINFAIKKCQDFSIDLQNKAKDKIKIQQKIKSVQQSVRILKMQIQSITTQSQRKKKLAAQIQYIFHQFFQPNRKSQVKDIYSQIQHSKIKKSLLQKQQQQAAQQGDLENYKRINNLIEEINFSIKQLQQKMKYQETNYYGNKSGNGVQGENLLSKIRQVVIKFGVEVDLGKVINKGPTTDLLNRITRRLIPL